MVKLVFPKWPFEKGYKTTIHWVKSPILKKSPDSQRQWMAEVLVKGENEKIKEVAVSWGMLPSLRIGMTVIDGKIDTKETFTKSCSYDLQLPEDAKYSIGYAIDLIPFKLFTLHTKSIFYERCFLFQSGKKKIIVPCVELIRFVFGLNKWLTQSLMEVDSLSSYVQGSLDEDKVQLEFNSNVSLSAIRTKKVLSVISRCLFDVEWSNAWNSIFTQRMSRGKTDSYISLDMIPPIEIYKSCKWDIRGVKQDEFYFVEEFIDIRPRKLYPYKEIHYTHPRLLFSPKKNRRMKKKIYIKKEFSNGEIHVDQTLSSPQNTKNPVSVEVNPTGILYLNSVLIQGEYKENSTGVRKGESYQEIILVDEEKELSFNAEAALGKIQAAEFISWDEHKYPVLGFEPFFLAINELIKIVNPMVEISYINGIAPQTSPLTFYQEGDKYILVKCSHPEGDAFILEVEQIEGPGLSTLLFTSREDVTKTVNLLLSEYLSFQRSWKRRKFKDYEDGVIDYAKHSSDSFQLWALRLRSKIRKITEIIDF